MTARHLIERLAFDIEYDVAEADAPDEDRIVAFVREALLPVVDEVLAAWDEADTVLTLPELALDLGTIERHALREQAPARLRVLLDDALAEARARSRMAGAPDDGPIGRSRQADDLAQLARYLASGRMAWHADAKRPDLHGELLARVLAAAQADAAPLLAALASTLAQPQALRRLREQFSHAQLRALLALALPADRARAGDAPAWAGMLAAVLGVAWPGDDPRTPRRDADASGAELDAFGVNDVHATHPVRSDVSKGARARSKTDQRDIALYDGDTIALLARFLRNGRLDGAQETGAGEPAMHVALLERAVEGPVEGLRALVHVALAAPEATRRLLEQFGAAQLAALLRALAPGPARATQAWLAAVHACAEARGVHRAEVDRAAWPRLFAAALDGGVDVAATQARIETALGWAAAGAGREVAADAAVDDVDRVAIWLRRGMPTPAPAALLERALARALAGTRAAALRTLLEDAIAAPQGAYRLATLLGAPLLRALARLLRPHEHRALCAWVEAATAALAVGDGGAYDAALEARSWTAVLRSRAGALELPPIDVPAGAGARADDAAPGRRAGAGRSGGRFDPDEDLGALAVWARRDALDPAPAAPLERLLAHARGEADLGALRAALGAPFATPEAAYRFAARVPERLREALVRRVAPTAAPRLLAQAHAVHARLAAARTRDGADEAYLRYWAEVLRACLGKAPSTLSPTVVPENDAAGDRLDRQGVPRRHGEPGGVGMAGLPIGASDGPFAQAQGKAAAHDATAAAPAAALESARRVALALPVQARAALVRTLAPAHAGRLLARVGAAGDAGAAGADAAPGFALDSDTAADADRWAGILAACVLDDPAASVTPAAPWPAVAARAGLLDQLETFLLSGRLAWQGGLDPAASQVHVQMLDALIDASLAQPAAAAGLWRVLARALAAAHGARRLVEQFPERQLRAILCLAVPGQFAPWCELARDVEWACIQAGVASGHARVALWRVLLVAAVDAALAASAPPIGVIRAALLAALPELGESAGDAANADDGANETAVAGSASALPAALVRLCRVLDGDAGATSEDDLLGRLLAHEPKATLAALRPDAALAAAWPDRLRRLVDASPTASLRVLVRAGDGEHAEALLGVVDAMLACAHGHAGYPLAARWCEVLQAALAAPSAAQVLLLRARIAGSGALGWRAIVADATPARGRGRGAAMAADASGLPGRSAVVAEHAAMLALRRVLCAAAQLRAGGAVRIAQGAANPSQRLAGAATRSSLAGRVRADCAAVAGALGLAAMRLRDVDRPAARGGPAGQGATPLGASEVDTRPWRPGADGAPRRQTTGVVAGVPDPSASSIPSPQPIADVSPRARSTSGATPALSTAIAQALMAGDDGRPAPEWSALLSGRPGALRRALRRLGRHAPWRDALAQELPERMLRDLVGLFDAVLAGALLRLLALEGLASTLGPSWRRRLWRAGLEVALADRGRTSVPDTASERILRRAAGADTAAQAALLACWRDAAAAPSARAAVSTTGVHIAPSVDAAAISSAPARTQPQAQPRPQAQRHPEAQAQPAPQRRPPAASPSPGTPDAPGAPNAPGADEGERIAVANAGLVLAAPYLPQLFKLLGLVRDGRFVDVAAAERAVHLLQWAVSGQGAAPEYQLALNKLLCGLPLDAPVPAGIEVGDAERRTLESLLQAIVAAWEGLGRTSIDGLRQTFLRRDGELELCAEAWQLTVAPGPYDMLMDRLPWSFSIVKFPWMALPLHVVWR